MEKNKIQVMVINDYFDTGSMLIIKYGRDSQITKNYKENITPEKLEKELFSIGIDVKDENCELIVVDKNWKGKIKVEQH